MIQSVGKVVLVLQLLVVGPFLLDPAGHVWDDGFEGELDEDDGMFDGYQEDGVGEGVLLAHIEDELVIEVEPGDETIHDGGEIGEPREDGQPAKTYVNCSYISMLSTSLPVSRFIWLVYWCREKEKLMYRLTKAKRGAPGKMGENIVMYPN